MPEIKQTKEQLLKRRDEINAELDRVNKSERLELDNDLEEQSIETEQEEVSIAMEANLRKELAEIEDKLLDFEE
jgi:RNA polymerase-binding transcription factor DksA